MPYFMINNNDDGQFTFKEIDPDNFLKELSQGYYGPNPDMINFLSYSPKILPNMDEWRRDTYLIIKGEIVFPRPKKTVVEYQF